MYSQEGGRGKRGRSGEKMTSPFEGHIDEIIYRPYWRPYSSPLIHPNLLILSQKFSMVVEHILHELWHLHALNKHLFLCVGILVHMSNTGFRPFFEQKIQGLFKDFQELISHFSRTPFNANYRVSSEIQGLSSTNCNFQGLSRPWIFILKFKDFKGACEPYQYTNWVGLSTLWKGSCVKRDVYSILEVTITCVFLSVILVD